MHSVQRATTKELRAAAKAFVNGNHSYIQWADRPSRKMYWLLFEDNRLVGVFGLGSAFARPKAVQDYMARHSIAFNELANNIVYCLSGHTDRNAGTKFLSLLRKDAKVWWAERYGDTLKAMQTFILPPRTGAVYKADNWKEIGLTTGKSSRMRTLYGEDREKYTQGVEIRTFKSGEVKYALREYHETEQKLIFMRAV